MEDGKDGGLKMLNCSVRIPATAAMAVLPGVQENGDSSSGFRGKEKIRRPMVDQFCRTARKEHEGLSQPNEDQCQDRSRGVNEALLDSASTAWEQKLITFKGIAEERRELLLSRARRITNNRDDAEDIVQEALLKGFKYLPQFRGESMMYTWLVAIVQNVGHEWLRRQKRRTYIQLGHLRDSDDLPFLDELADPCEDPEHFCERLEMSKLLHSEIDKLKSVCKQALRICVIEERSHLEAANALRTKVSTIKARISRGKRILRRAIHISTSV